MWGRFVFRKQITTMETLNRTMEKIIVTVKCKDHTFVILSLIGTLQGTADTCLAVSRPKDKPLGGT